MSPIALLNSLPSNYYAQDHIPNSWNLHYLDVKKMTQNQVHDWFIGLLKHYPKLNKWLIKTYGFYIHRICEFGNASLILCKG